MSTIKHTVDFRINQPIDLVFPLFSAEGEKLWVPGWDYENIMCSNELHEDYVFITKNHDHSSTDAIWLVKQFEPEIYLVQFYKIEPEDKVGIVTIKCKKIEDGLTEVKVSYEYIGLSKKGNEFIKGFTLKVYKAFIRKWNEFLVNYFESKC